MKKNFSILAGTAALGIALGALSWQLQAAEAEKVSADADAAPAVVTNAAPGEVKQQLAPAVPSLSPGLAEIIRLAQAKVGEDVLLAYVARSSHPYNPSTEEIIYLHDLGVSDAVIAEIVKRSPNPNMQTAEAKPATAEALNIPEVKTAAAPQAPAAPTVPTLTPLVSTNPAPAYVEQPAPVQQPVVVQQPVIVEQPIVIQQAPEEVRYFYSSLAPYGSWVEVDGYGWCWQPTVAVTYVDWRPYHHSGRWIYTDCGWYWQSDYSWGWAPFHYGRWFNHPRRGWCWMPDRVWGPAWVSWRNSSSYCGWAPLPPVARYHHGFGLSYFGRHVGISFEFGLGALDYTFVSHHHFYSHNPYRHCVPRTQVTKIYNQTVVNNVIVQGNNNNVVINQGGAPVTQISQATRMEVQKVKVVDMPAAQRSGVQPDRLVRNGSSLAVYRPSGPSSGLSRQASEPVKTASPASGRPSGTATPRNHAPADLHPEVTKTRPTAPATALQRFEAPKSSTGLPVLSRPQTSTARSTGESSPRVGMPTQPAGTGIDRPLSPQQPVKPAKPTTGRGMVYTPPGKRPPEATRPGSSPQPVSGPTVTPSAPKPVSGPTVTLSQPKPVSGAPATPSPGRPVTPATPGQSRLTPQSPVSTYQPPPTAGVRTEPSRPSSVTITRPAGSYGQRPSEQSPSRGSLPRTELPSTRELPRATVEPARPMRSYPVPTYTRPAPTYSQPAPTYSAPVQTQRPTVTTPAQRSYEAPRSYSSPSSSPAAAPRPSYSAPASRPSYSAPASRPSYTPPPAAAPAPRSVAPQSVTLPQVSAPRPSVSAPASRPGGGGNARPSPGQGSDKRPGSR